MQTLSFAGRQWRGGQGSLQHLLPGPFRGLGALRRALGGLPAPSWGSDGLGRGCWSDLWGPHKVPPGLQAFWATLSLGQDLCALGVGTWVGGEEGMGGAAPGSRLIGLGICGQRLREGGQGSRSSAIPSLFLPSWRLGNSGWSGISGLGALPNLCREIWSWVGGVGGVLSPETPRTSRPGRWERGKACWR